MKSATKTAAQALGVYAGLLAMEHGVFEILQGGAAVGGMMINAIGPPCQAEAVWHACLPAMTVLPSFLVAGVLTVVVSLIVVIWSVGFVARRRGGLALILLSIIALLVGGGFVAPFTGFIAGTAATQIRTPLRGMRKRVPDAALRALAALWPWTLVAVVLWFPAAWVLGHFFSGAMLRLSSLLFVAFDLALPLLTLISGLAQDGVRRKPTGTRG